MKNIDLEIEKGGKIIDWKIHLNNTNYSVHVSHKDDILNFSNITMGPTYLQVDYIFLDNNERLKFARSDHEYLIEYLQYDNENILINNNNKIKVDYSNPVKCLFFVTQYEYILTSSLLDVFNYTTNIDKKRGKNIINYVQFLINGKDRITQRSSEYYSWIQNYQNFSNAANEGINIYSFSLKNEEYQPSGACNFSKIEDITLGLSVDNSVNYNNPLRARIYALSYNVLRIINGVCSLAFN